MENSNLENFGDLYRSAPNCPPVDLLLAENSSGEVRSHAAACPHCQTELALFRNFAQAAPRRGEWNHVQWITKRLKRTKWDAAQPGVVPETKPAWWKQIVAARFLTPAFAAVASVLLVVGVVQVSHRPGLPPEVRISEDQPFRSSQLDVIAPVGAVVEAPAQLRWRAVPGAAGYEIRVLEVDRTELWRTTVPTTSVAMPEQVRDRLVPGKRVLWEVTARNATGAEIAASGLKSLIIEVKEPK